MTSTITQNIDDRSALLINLSQELQEQAGNIKEKHLKTLEQSLSSLYGILGQLGVDESSREQ